VAGDLEPRGDGLRLEPRRSSTGGKSQSGERARSVAGDLELRGDGQRLKPCDDGQRSRRVLEAHG
jgi:hypothetical protein